VQCNTRWLSCSALDSSSSRPQTDVIPGPRPHFEFSSVKHAFTDGAGGHNRVTDVSQILEKIRRPQPRFKVVPSPPLNLHATIRQPMYQWWHGYGAVRHLFENPTIALVLGTLGSGP